jgi:RNA polymerase sigma factor (sigma-70 family)
MSEPDVTRASLLVRVKDPQDKKAWGDFVQIYMPMVQRYCRRRGLQDADATDVSQDVMKSIAQAIERFQYDPAHGQFRNWLFTVTRSKLNNFFGRKVERGSGRTTIQQQLEEQPGREETAAWEEDCRRQLFEWAAKQARAEFEEKTWKAFLMTAVEGKEVKEASSATGLSANAVYVARSRVMARLRELVSGVEEGAELF